MTNASRHQPAHGIISDTSRPTIVFVTICVSGRTRSLDDDLAHQIIRDASSDGSRWRVGRYVLMPDHAHFFVAPNGEDGTRLEDWMGYWKSRTAYALRRSGAERFSDFAWQRDYWDRRLRSNDSYAEKSDYVDANPVRAGLAKTARDWPYRGVIFELDWL